ncbi:TetR/AcrR family transcriptional regulator [Paenibacillus sp. MMS20-IR301]|uniref:TetR/AcrR family transcriptional regulator n=1 Tax=Paenibacillus sp. MMS20-IR301 TaxID=2895946 RepID=UPI0028ECD657|nr:TetR/AcrR family transcriptional regulator [Paenibacillus sp. MMS20-IR301]WNS46947.1 TetR/AcrR family transcriptional regulator [Paenibacillus sp. MMS20-IR301]
MSDNGKLLVHKFNEGFELLAPDKATRQIIEHAALIFSRKGYAGTKIKDIAASAGFSQGYVYMYFKSKDEIFTKVVELASEGAGMSVQYAAELEGSPLERITWLTEAFISPDSIAMQHWRLILLQTATPEAIPEEAGLVAKAKIMKPFEHLIPLIIAGQQAGEIVAGDPAEIAVAYFSFIQGLGIARLQTTAAAPFPSAELVLRFMKRS